MGRERRGLGYGIAAYLIWGLFPLYWPLLEPAGAVEILAHRVAWSAITMVVVVVLANRLSQLMAILRSPRSLVLLTVAAVVIGINWGTFIWGVNNDHVVEASLGYFINPLVTVLMGVLILGERLRRWQWVAIALAAGAVTALTIEYGHPPWVALVLALSFGSYGLVKKIAGVEAVESLTFETIALAPLAIGYIVWLSASGQGHFATEGPLHAVLLAATGTITAIPLLCFGAAAIRISMTTLGLLQYLTPTMQFLLGILVFDEQLSPVRWAGFALVWCALMIFTVEALRHHRTQLRLSAEASAL